MAARTLQVSSSETGFRFELWASRIAQLSGIDVLSLGVPLRRGEELFANLSKARKTVARKNR